LTTIKPLIILITMLFVAESSFSQQAVINEFMAKNNNVIADDFGEYPDWIEIFNPGTETINLLNWALSDDSDDLMKWSFPNLLIAPDSFLLVFASGQNTVSPGGIHTNFKIKASGEALFLSNNQGQIIDQIAEIELEGNQSCGRTMDGGSVFEKFYTSSPGTSNATNTHLNELTSSHPSGFYTHSISLSINSSKTNDTVYYTIDGSCPTTASLIYENPINFTPGIITNPNLTLIPTTPLEGPWQLSQFIWKQPDSGMFMANILRYRSFSGQKPSSKIFAGSYMLDDDIFFRFSLPVISIISDTANLFNYDTGIYIPGRRFVEDGWNWFPDGNYMLRGRAWERFAQLEVFEENGNQVLSQDCGLRIFGGWSAAMPQKSLRIIADNDYGENRFNYEFFPDLPYDEYKQIVLRNSGNDFIKSRFRDALMQSLLSDLDLELQAYRPACLFINGNYWGIHNMREKYDEHYFERRFGVDEDNLILVNVCGTPEFNDNQDYLDMIAFIKNNSLAIQSNFEYIQSKMDVLNFIDYHIAEIFFCNNDWPGNNNKAWKTTLPDSKWRWLIFDLDFGFGYESDYNYNSIEHALLENGPPYPNPDCSTFLLRSLLENNDFKTLFLDRFAYHLNTTFHKDTVINRIDNFITQLGDEMHFHIQRWHYPQTYNDWLNITDNMKEFATNRPCVCVSHIIEKFDPDEFGFDCEGSGGIANYETPDFKIFPNPSDGHIYLQNHCPSKTLTSISVFNAYGQIVSHFNFENINTEKIDLSDLQNGLYMFLISTHTNSSTLKIIIKK